MNNFTNGSDDMHNLTFREVWFLVSESTASVADRIHIKAAFSLPAIPAMFLLSENPLHALIQLWLYVNVIDLCFAVWLAIKCGKSVRQKSFGWSVKLTTHMVMVLLGMILQLGADLLVKSMPLPFQSDYLNLPWAHGIVTILLLNETINVVDTMRKLDLPISEDVYKVLTFFKRRQERQFMDKKDSDK